MKKLMGLFLVIVMFLSCIPVAASGVNVYIDGKAVAFSDSTGYPFISEGRTLVPLRVTMESFGASVEWDGASQTAFVRQGSTTVRCIIGENCIYRNNVKITNDAAAVIVNGRTYLPIRAVLEAFGAQVNWDGSVRVTSSSGGSLINEIEGKSSVTSNYWKIWNEAISLKEAGNYSQAVEKIKSISSVFIQKNDDNSRAILFKHLGECYANLSDYASASACFKREAYYWDKAPGMIESKRDAERRSQLINTNSQVYVKSTDKNMGGITYFGESHEPQGGVYLGAYAEGDLGIYDPYGSSSFYMDTFPALVGKDMAGYLIYMPYGTDLSVYNVHLANAKKKNKIVQLSLEPHGGVDRVNKNDSYLIQLAKDMQGSGCKMMLRFAGEMNDTTSSWYTNPSTYIEKFRIVADVFHKYAPSVPVIWAPNFYPSDTIDDYYPGDNYVDYVGISSYMMHQPITDPLGKGVDRNRWSSQLDTIYSLYGHKKPIIIVESGATYMDYDTWADITPFASYQIQDFYTYLAIKYPNVKMCFIFDCDEERRKFCLSKNSQYLAGYREGISSDLYLSSTGNSAYRYHYYELGNNVNVKAEKTELCSYITSPANDIAYVVYSINGVDYAPVYGTPYRMNIDFAPFKGQKVTVNIRSYNSSYTMITNQTVTINVN